MTFTTIPRRLNFSHLLTKTVCGNNPASVKLPNAENAVVEREKVVNYLLDPTHPDNGGKADFFTRLGFTSAQWDIFAAALTALAVESEVVNHSSSSHGRKFVLAGQIRSLGGKSPWVQSIWIVDNGRDTARLVTAYPGKQ